jgi:AcrR family transcriptional regulator
MRTLTRRQRETEALREQVLDKAEDIFVREGINRVTMRRISASIDYAPTVLYRLFTNKADLVDHLIARGYDGVRSKYEAVLSQKNMDSISLLKGILETYVDYALSHPNHYRMWFDTSSVVFGNQELRMTHGRLEYVVFKTWLDCIEACQADGLFSKLDLMDIFQILWSRIHGLISLRLQHPDMTWMPLTQHLETVLPTDNSGQ